MNSDETLAQGQRSPKRLCRERHSKTPKRKSRERSSVTSISPNTQDLARVPDNVTSPLEIEVVDDVASSASVVQSSDRRANSDLNTCEAGDDVLELYPHEADLMPDVEEADKSDNAGPATSGDHEHDSIVTTERSVIYWFLREVQSCDELSTSLKLIVIFFSNFQKFSMRDAHPLSIAKSASNTLSLDVALNASASMLM